MVKILKDLKMFCFMFLAGMMGAAGFSAPSFAVVEEYPRASPPVNPAYREPSAPPARISEVETIRSRPIYSSREYSKKTKLENIIIRRSVKMLRRNYDGHDKIVIGAKILSDLLKIHFGSMGWAEENDALEELARQAGEDKKRLKNRLPSNQSEEGLIDLLRSNPDYEAKVLDMIEKEAVKWEELAAGGCTVGVGLLGYVKAGMLCGCKRFPYYGSQPVFCLSGQAGLCGPVLVSFEGQRISGRMDGYCVGSATDSESPDGFAMVYAQQEVTVEVGTGTRKMSSAGWGVAAALYNGWSGVVAMPLWSVNTNYKGLREDLGMSPG